MARGLLTRLPSLTIWRHSIRKRVSTLVPNRCINKLCRSASLVRGGRHPAVGICLNNLANLYHAQGLSEFADRYYREALAVRETTSGQEAALTGTILGNWAWLQHERGLLDEAKFRYERALVIQQKTLGSSHPMVAMLLDRYAGLLRDLGQRSQAGLVATRAAAIRAQRNN